MKKVYIADTGMRNCLLNYFPEPAVSTDDGALFENFIFHRLRERYDLEEIKYWRTADQKEVDFVVDAPNTRAAYEVKYNASAVKPGKYKVFANEYTEYPLGFIFRKPFSEERIREMAFLTK